LSLISTHHAEIGVGMIVFHHIIGCRRSIGCR